MLGAEGGTGLAVVCDRDSVARWQVVAVVSVVG